MLVVVCGVRLKPSARDLSWCGRGGTVVTVGVPSVNPVFIAPSMQPPDLQNRSEPVRRVHYELALRTAKETGRIFRSSPIEGQRHYRGRERIVQTVSKGTIPSLVASRAGGVHRGEGSLRLRFQSANGRAGLFLDCRNGLLGAHHLGPMSPPAG